MDKVTEFIESGILEIYVLGQATEQEEAEVAHMAGLHEEVRREIEAISIALESYAEANAMELDPMIEPFLMARIDYIERLKAGEEASFPPVLHKDSKIADYAQWLNREDLQLTQPLHQVLARIIGFTPQVTTAIVWLEHGAPPETHTNEFEQFLIVEGTCNIVIDQDVHPMKAGDVLIIPLYKSHHVQVTSAIPCKIILQRVAA